MGNFSLNLLTFPFWWYTRGFALVLKWSKREINYGLSETGLLIFARHLREPLYGDYTKAGIILGFFLRIVLLAYKLLILCIRAAIVVIFNLLYLLILPAALVMILYQFLSL
jgi:hypothetical protein